MSTCFECDREATMRLAVWSSAGARVTDRMEPYCDTHGQPLLDSGDAALLQRIEPSACVFANTGNGPCGGPSNGLYCWDHKDLRHGGQS